MSHLNYLNGPYDDNFKELCASMPLFYLDVFEMREILKAEGRLLDGVCDGFELILANNFILPADEPTIAKWEKALRIFYEEELTLDQRKQAVIAKITGYGHIGEPEIRAIIACYTAGAVSVAFARGVIYLVIEGEIPGEATLYTTLLDRIPAHLRLGMKIHIRRAYRQDVTFSNGGAVITSFHPDPVGEDRVSRAAMTISFGGAALANLDGQPIPIDMQAVTGVPVAYGAFLEPLEDGTQPNTRSAHTRRGEAAGGLYYHSHIKSKLIE